MSSDLYHTKGLGWCQMAGLLGKIKEGLGAEAIKCGTAN